MKKLIILIICLFLVTGCFNNKKNEDTEHSEEKFILEKIDNDRDYVYLEEYKKLKYNDGKEYILNNLVLNIKGNVVDNINLEIKNYVMNSYHNMSLKDDVINYGNIIDFDYYVTEKYISIVQNVKFYINNMMSDKDTNVYVISLLDGKLMNNDKILDEYDLDEDKILEYLEEHIDNEDKDYVLMQIKNDGYKLFINDEGKVVISYNDILDDISIRKELVIK